MKTIVCLDGYTLNPGDNPWRAIEKIGDFHCYERSTSGIEQVIERAHPAHILLTNKTCLDRQVIDACPQLECIVVLATGYNVVDVEYAKQKGIVVMNVPSYGNDTVAEMVFALLFQLARNVGRNCDDVRKNLGWSQNKDWSYWLSPQMELAGKTIGIIGFGNIGQRVGAIAQAFNMKVLAHDRTPKTYPSYPHQHVDIDTIFRDSDIVSLHCPAQPETENMINAERLEQMKPSALLINTARGQLIDEQALANALNKNHIFGAALDTLWQEPPLQNNPLLTAKCCVITPHIAWATLDARQRIMDIVAKNVASFLAGQPQNIV